MRIRTRLILSFSGIALLTSLLALVLSYTMARRHFIHQTRQDLIHLASALSTSLDTEALRSLTIEQESTEAYQAVKARFRRFRQAVPDARLAYFYRPTDKPGILEMVVDTVEPGEPDAITPDPNDRYYDAGAVGATSMTEGLTHPAADDEPITDPSGTWLSGYAPVFDSKHESIGAIGIDLSAQHIAKQEGELLGLLTLGSLLTLAAALLGALTLGRAISRPIQDLAQATRVLAGGDLAARVQAARLDEIGQLGQDFNQMSANLQAMADALKRYTTEAIESHEENMALQLQKLLLPPSEFVAPGVEISSALRPIPWGGGDTYQYFLFGQGAYLFLAYGHIHAAGLVACSLMTLLHSRQSQLVSELVLQPSELLRELGKTLREAAPGLAAVDWLCAVYDIRNAALAFSGAGQLGVFLVRPEPFAVRILDSSTAHLGEDAERPDVDLEIQPGDRLLVCSAPTLERLGAERFEQLLRQGSAQRPSQLRDSLLRELAREGGAEPQDDVTVIVSEFGRMGESA